MPIENREQLDNTINEIISSGGDINTISSKLIEVRDFTVAEISKRENTEKQNTELAELNKKIKEENVALFLKIPSTDTTPQKTPQQTNKVYNKDEDLKILREAIK